MNRIVTNVLLLILLIGIGVGIYSNSLNSPFHFDDYEFITQNSAIKDLNDVKAIFHATHVPVRFIAFYTFALNHHFHQLDVFGYHVVNIIIHLLNTILVWILLNLTFGLKGFRGQRIYTSRRYIAFFGALLFLSHPVQTEAVTYLCQRFTSLVTFFYLSTLLFYVKAREESIQNKKIVFFTLSLVTALLGMMTKQIMLTIPFSIILYEILFLSEGKSLMNVVRARWKIFAAILPFFLIVPLMYSLDIKAFLSIEAASRSHIGDVLTPISYFFTQFKVLVQYLKLFFIPIGLNFDYDFRASYSLFDRDTAICFFTLLGMLIYAFKVSSKQKCVSFGILWFFVTLMVESTFIVILQVIYEHRMYLPMFGLSMAFCVTVFYLFKSVKKFTVAMCIIVTTLGYLTYQRNTVWATEISLWKDIRLKSPSKVRPTIHLGVFYLMNGEYDRALLEFNAGQKIDPENHKIYHNRGIVYNERRQFLDALADYNRAIALDDTYAETFNNRGGVYEQLNKFNLAFQDYSKAIEINQNYALAYLNRGNLYYRARRYKKALVDILHAQELGYPIEEKEMTQLLKLANPESL